MRLWYRMIFVGTVTAFAGGCLGEFQEIEAPFVENLRLQSVSVGGFHACAVNDDATVYCWGLNSVGQLGDMTLANKSTPVRVAGGSLTFESVTAGGAHTCALTTSGAAYCWGVNTSGQIGGGDLFGNGGNPVPVAGDLTFSRLSAGGAHTCGVTVDGAAYCWGSEARGQLGTGMAGPELMASPQLVVGGHTFTSILAGAEHTCGVVQGGAAYCWGAGTFGQLGNGATGSEAAPMPVAGDLFLTEVIAGGLHTCGVTFDREVYCWGEGANGQLGNGGTGNSSTPVMVPVPGGELATFSTVSAGGSHTCAILPAGAHCWGVNDSGQLGDGTTGTRDAPAAVTGGLTFSTISAGLPPFAASTCGITRDRIVYCWGSGDSGQLGNGDSVDQSTPVRVAGQT